MVSPEVEMPDAVEDMVHSIHMPGIEKTRTSKSPRRKKKHHCSNAAFRWGAYCMVLFDILNWTKPHVQHIFDWYIFFFFKERIIFPNFTFSIQITSSAPVFQNYRLLLLLGPDTVSVFLVSQILKLDSLFTFFLNTTDFTLKKVDPNLTLKIMRDCREFFPHLSSIQSHAVNICDDTINISPGQWLGSCDGPRGRMRPLVKVPIRCVFV
jgi:hypothetical protein